MLALTGNNLMPNFFKKLTSSFKMEEENDTLKNEDNENDSPEEYLNEIEENNDIESEDSDEQDTQEADSNEESIEDESDLDKNYQDNDDEQEAEDEEVSMPDDSSSVDTSLGEGEKPYTIAQLASAQTTKERTSAKVSKKKLPRISLYSTADSSDNESNMPEGQLAIDVYETDLEIVVKSTIAGAKPEDLDVGIEDNTANIRGSRHNEEKIKGENYLYQECYWGTFSRSIILPVEVDADKAEASLKDGILTIRIPKIKRNKEKKLKILS